MKLYAGCYPQLCMMSEHFGTIYFTRCALLTEKNVSSGNKSIKRTSIFPITLCSLAGEGKGDVLIESWI